MNLKKNPMKKLQKNKTIEFFQAENNIKKDNVIDNKDTIFSISDKTNLL